MVVGRRRPGKAALTHRLAEHSAYPELALPQKR